MTEDTNTTLVAKSPRKMAREPNVELAHELGAEAKTASDPAPLAKPQTKAALVLEMLQCSGGASVGQLVSATGWLPHTTRAALTGLRKKGHAIERVKVDGETRYNIAVTSAQ